MTPAERVECALLGGQADRVPFTTYFNKMFASRAERTLRNEGLCMVESYRVQPFVVESPGVVETTLQSRAANGQVFIKRTVQTEAGVITALDRQLPEHPRIPGQYLPWHEEFLFKGPSDYPAIMAMVSDRVYRPLGSDFRRMQEEAEGDVFLLPDIGYSRGELWWECQPGGSRSRSVQEVHSTALQ